MPFYRSIGKIPPKRHIKLPLDPATSFRNEGLAYEHVVTTEGFHSEFSILYHLKPPTRVREARMHRRIELKPAFADHPLRHHHLKTKEMARAGDLYEGRVPIFFNQDVVAYRCRPAKAYGNFEYYRNGSADEVIFVNAGGGTLESLYGRQRYRAGDYVVIPRSTTYRLVPDEVTLEDYLILETFSPVRIPSHYKNRDGQIRLGAPYCERDLHGPTELIGNDEETDIEVLIKERERYSVTKLASHPFDVIGWAGCLYPFTFNVDDFEPLTGTVHLPPPAQQTFDCRGYVICTFAPRHLDHHPQAIKVPYVHDNVEADEVLFYVRGNFGSRKGIEPCSFTLHPQGIPHGPHPGTIIESMKAERTEELAVMFDTEHRLHIAQEAVAMDDPNYPQSWL
jgi:homogentisate 1,2-dioxygenase